MGGEKKPKDFELAEEAYNAFYGGLQVPFDELRHEYQMKWVRAARAVAGAYKRKTPGGTWELMEDQPSDEAVHATAHKRGPGGKVVDPGNLRSRIKTLSDMNVKDQMLFTDKKDKSVEEKKARWRVDGRFRRIAIYGKRLKAMRER